EALVRKYWDEVRLWAGRVTALGTSRRFEWDWNSLLAIGRDALRRAVDACVMDESLIAHRYVGEQIHEAMLQFVFKRAGGQAWRARGADRGDFRKSRLPIELSQTTETVQKNSRVGLRGRNFAGLCRLTNRQLKNISGASSQTQRRWLI